MAPLQLRTVSVVFAFVLLTIAGVQRTEAKNGGRLFALSFIELTGSGTPFEEIFISSFKETTLVNISIPQIKYRDVISLDSSNNWMYSKTIMQDISVPINVDAASSMAIIIAAQNGDINVHANKAHYGTGAAYLALALQKRPTPLYNHYVPGCNITGLFFSSDWIYHSFVSVVSVYESTDVEVIKYSDVIGGPSQRLHFRTMQANEVFNMYSNSTDYTGVLVSARKPVAVFGGCDCVNIPDRVAACDHIMAQAPYVQQLGSEAGTQFVMASIPGRPYNVGFFFRIIAAPPGNSLTVTVTEYNYNTDTPALDSQTPLLTAATLAKGSYLEFNAGHGKDKFTVVYISCSSLCEVLQYNPSLEVVTPVLSSSDPAMVLVPSTAKYTVDIKFPTSSVSDTSGSAIPARNYLTFVAKTSSKDTLTLDNTLISALSGFQAWISVPAMPDIHVALFNNIGYEVSEGFHTLTTTGMPPDENQYNAFVYGHGTRVSYGYLAGYDLAAEETATTGEPPAGDGPPAKYLYAIIALGAFGVVAICVISYLATYVYILKARAGYSKVIRVRVASQCPVPDLSTRCQHLNHHHHLFMKR